MRITNRNNRCGQILVLTVLINYKVSGAEVFGVGPGVLQQEAKSAPNFFQMLSKVPFNIYDIAAMYRNVTNEAVTGGCLGVCRTPIAIWVVQSLSQCQDITKEDCPIGLVCCKIEPVISNNLRRSDTVALPHVNSEWNEDEFDNSSFHQDPIPGDRDR